ncbi:hypothetical protein PanWU01x14_360100 [Parasponia andersonii]|uniref:Uncharacterized protein n=1 Tax=Parasponia andersonii TaxID=3476 RepID=A0A2P5A7R3_PARAD|nr:hypothetical protein PanWU01x14_360100 [Parasponia andersonii]
MRRLTSRSGHHRSDGHLLMVVHGTSGSRDHVHRMLRRHCRRKPSTRHLLFRPVSRRRSSHRRDFLRYILYVVISSGIPSDEIVVALSPINRFLLLHLLLLQLLLLLIMIVLHLQLLQLMQLPLNLNRVNGRVRPDSPIHISPNRELRSLNQRLRHRRRRRRRHRNPYSSSDPLLETEQVVNVVRARGFLDRVGSMTRHQIQSIDELFTIGGRTVRPETTGGGVDHHGEEEQPHPGGLGGGAVEAVILVHHVLEVVVVGDGDQGVEVLPRELVLERHVTLGEGGELGDHGGELDSTVDGEDLGLAADVAELVVVGTGEDLTAIAAHELGLVALVSRWGRLIVPGRRVLELDFSGTGRRVARVRVRAVREILHG